MGIIKVLDQQVADKIAAGEVIERPLSIVKELIENSIDARANNIEIEIVNGGVSKIAIRDNGIGMDQEDLAAAFIRHATSKIEVIQDLYHLNTFGFRGEALPSIAAVSQVEMTSCQKDAPYGHKITLTAGLPPVITEVSPGEGTLIEVKNLFYNIPARRKFLKSNSYEAGLIGELISKYALGHPNIRFKLVNNGQTTMDTVGLYTIQERMCYFYGSDVEEYILHIPNREFEKNRRFHACLLKEEVNRSNRNQEIFFVNGRLIKNALLSKALEEGYYTLLPKGRFPIAVVSLDLPGDQLDVNIHPAKLEIKINDFEPIKKALVEAIKDALWQASISKNAFLLKEYRPQHSSFIENAQQAIDLPQAQTNDEQEVRKTYPNLEDIKHYIEEKLQQSEDETAAKKTEIATENDDLLRQSDKPKTALQDIFGNQTPVQIETVQEEKKLTEQTLDFPKKTISVRESTQKQSSNIVTFPKKDSSKTTQTKNLKNINDLTLIGQLNQSFILAQNKEGLYIIDQHTLHERILYERFMRAENEKDIVVENLLIPVTVNLTARQEGVLLHDILLLRQLGFIVEEFGDRCYLLRALPQGFHELTDIAGFFIDLLDDLSEEKEITLAILKEKIITQASCKGAVKAHWKLTETEMLALLEQLDAVENAHSCPHGRPIVYKISMSELYAIFKRGTYVE